MIKEKGMVRYKESIINKLKSFLRRIFYKVKYQENEKYNQNNDFRKEIEIKPDEEKLRILKLQEDYEKGLIEEIDISKEDYEKLLILYDEQNKKIEEEIEKERIETKKMLQQLKRV